MEWITMPEAWLALLTLTFLEIVLGIDNLIFISILTQKLPVKDQARARVIGLSLAMGGRIALLFSLSLIMKLTHPWFSLFGFDFSGKDLVMIGGGLFLLAKATFEIHEHVEVPDKSEQAIRKVGSFASVLVQILLIDLVFSLDSVITAVGMSEHLTVMVIAVVVAVIIMMVVSGPLSRFIEKNPTLKILALSFLLLIGMALMGEGLHFHIPKGYLYFAIAFSLFVEIVNMRVRRKFIPKSAKG